MRLPNRARRFWLPLVVLGGLLGVTPASAYYDDIHYALTYYIARQVGYTPEQAFRIASANVSIDWSDPTEPVQAGISAIYFLPRAQEPRWRYHAFRNEILFNDAVGDGRDADAADAMIRGQRTALWDAAAELGNPGIFLHFFHDEIPHAKYGTRAGHWPVTEEADVRHHERLGLTIGGTTDWLSFWPIESNVSLVDQTAALLTSFMSKVSPKQQPRTIDKASCRALLLALREVNPFPAPLQGRSIDVLRRAKAAGATTVMDTDAAVGFVANQNDLSPAETDNISRQLRGPALAPAIEKVNEALRRAGMRAEPELPFETIPTSHRQYQYDAFGRLNGREQINSFVLAGTLKVKLVVKDEGEQPKTMKVGVRMAKTRPDDVEYALGDAQVTPGGEPAGSAPTWSSGAILTP